MSNACPTLFLSKFGVNVCHDLDEEITTSIINGIQLYRNDVRILLKVKDVNITPNLDVRNDENDMQ